MTDHHIGAEALALQALAEAGHGQPVHHPQFHILQVGLSRGGWWQRQVFERANTRHLAAPALGDEDHRIADLLEVSHQVEVLPREELMDEQEIHLRAD